MKVIAGTHGGLSYNARRGPVTHPMSERARGAIFNALGSLDGLVVLDAFAGSGALSFESVSRGAIKAYAIEIDPKSAKYIVENVEKLRMGELVQVVRANVSSWFKQNRHLQFDLVFADPPYTHLQFAKLELITENLVKGGLMVLSHPFHEDAPEVTGLNRGETRHYGDAQITYYRKK